MHPRSVGYKTIQHFNPRSNPRLNPQVEPTEILYHFFLEEARKLRIKDMDKNIHNKSTKKKH